MRKNRPALVVSLILFVAIFIRPAFAAKGHFEFSFHYGSWGLNLLKAAMENLAKSFAEQMKNDMMDQVKEDNPGEDLIEKSFNNDVEFDSGGHNYGFEIRWYPAGEGGSFSLGLSVEKTSMRIALPKVTTSIEIENQTSHEIWGFQGQGDAEIKSNPLAFLLSFRWDIKPSWKVHPYFTFGLGIAGASALDETAILFDFTGQTTSPGEPPKSIDPQHINKTLAQLKQEDADRAKKEDEEHAGDPNYQPRKPFSYPGFFPFIQLHFGLKAEVTSFLHVLVDAGIWDGFILRGGLALRF